MMSAPGLPLDLSRGMFCDKLEQFNITLEVVW
jgi:hypothetical protein